MAALSQNTVHLYASLFISLYSNFGHYHYVTCIYKLIYLHLHTCTSCK